MVSHTETSSGTSTKLSPDGKVAFPLVRIMVLLAVDHWPVDRR